MKQTLFALIDCNNFFVSCEQVFRPDLIGKPTIVLSSGDGCVIARSNEAKKLGIPMGAPVFKYQNIFREHQVTKFSANFELYGDISRRITEILTGITPRVEVYSIDESFLELSSLDIVNYEEWGKKVRSIIQKWVGVTVSIGIAPTKTLAKLASERAKKDPEHDGVLFIMPSGDVFQAALSKTPIEDLWGVGWKMAPRLRADGIETAWDTYLQEPYRGRKLYNSVFGERLVRELRGESCIPLEKIKVGQHSISATRTFGQDTGEQHVVEGALASFVARATHRLRSQHLKAGYLQIFLTSNRHKAGYQKWTRSLKLDQPTADTGVLTALANALFGAIYKPSASYHRGGVLLGELSRDGQFQTDLLGYMDAKAYSKEQRRMLALDGINDKYGRKTAYMASEDLDVSWEPKRQQRSPRYTTNWDELPIATINISPAVTL